MALSYHTGRRGFLGFLKTGLTDGDGVARTGVIPAFTQVDSAGVEVSAGTTASPSFTAGSRVLTPVTGTVANTVTTYGTAGLCIGGLITIATGLPAGTVLNTTLLRLRVRNADQAAGAPNSLFLFFNDNPTACTITDNVAFSMAAADLGKFILTVAVSWASSGPAATGVQSATANGPRLVVNSAGNVYAVLLCGGTSNTCSTANAISYEFEATY